MPATILLSAYPGRNLPGGRQLAIAIGGQRVPQRRITTADLLEIAAAVAAFGHEIQKANPGASFEVSARVISGRKPRGFDAADHATAFGGRAFLRSDVDDSALHQRLLDPVAA
jgi:hypothetical protein